MNNPPTTRAEAEAYQYNQQNNKPVGYDPKMCAMEITEHGRCVTFYQCSQKPGEGPAGLYCWRHARKLAARGLIAALTAPNDLAPTKTWKPVVGAKCEYNFRAAQWAAGVIKAVSFNGGEVFTVSFKHPAYDYMTKEATVGQLREPRSKSGPPKKKAGQAQAAAVKA